MIRRLLFLVLAVLLSGRLAMRRIGGAFPPPVFAFLVGASPLVFPFADYALTESAMVRMHAWVLQNHPEMADRMGETPSFMLAAKPQAMRNILDTMTKEYGSVRGYLSTIGIGQALLAEMADSITV